MVLCVIKKAQGSAPGVTDAARYARARKNTTEICKGGQEEEARDYLVRTASDNTKRCLCRAYCPALCCVLVDFTF